MLQVKEYLAAHWVEIAGAVISLIYLVLSIREKAGLWIFGFISSLLYVWVFFHSKLYAEISLQLYYLVISVYGWIHWRQKRDPTSSGSKLLPITHISGNKQIFYYTAGALAVYAVYYVVLRYLTDSPVPGYDSVVGSLSVIATWMLAKKKIENWLVWIAADGFACWLYFYKGLYPTAVLFVVYTCMAVVGYNQWKRNMKRDALSKL